jgi:signal transduction histidine kinase
MPSNPKNEPAVANHPAITKAISRGLHEMAQPLTVLHGALEVALMQSEPASSEAHQTLELARREMLRVCSSLEHLRHLVRLQLSPEEQMPVSIARVVQTVLERLSGQFSAARIQCTVARRPELEDLVTASEGRIQEAFLLVLSSAPAVMPIGERVVVDLASDPGTVTVKARFLSAGGNKLSLSNGVHLNLELSEAMLASAGGELAIEETPFSVSARLPLASVRSKKAGV